MSYRDDIADTIDNSDSARISALLVGRKVSKVSDDTLLLDDGTEVQILPNEGCGGCTAGWYKLAALNECDNVITRAEVAVGPQPGVDEDGDEWGEYTEAFRYTLFVYTEHQQTALAVIDGDDGNGYYGTGFEIVVKRTRA